MRFRKSAEPRSSNRCSCKDPRNCLKMMRGSSSSSLTASGPLLSKPAGRFTSIKRRHLLDTKVLPRLVEPIRQSPELKGHMTDWVRSVKTQGLEGLIAKRRNSAYEAGERSGAWQKLRINQGQEFVIGGYTIGGATFDALVFGYHEGKELIYAARTRNGFTPKLRAELLSKFEPLKISACPFSNLPEKRSGR
jgi:ATP-dependent DNA ligase